ncbi:MAG: hypothetical protein NTY30_02040 [Candidatus Berkelbacteria bacterium]|nr:hypothetical protein [Candidatus Berkelbacteria bacterium]
MKNSYTVLELPENSKKSLAAELENLGFVYILPEMGGGPSEVARLLIAWINIHDFWSMLFIGVLVNRIDKLISVIYDWFKKNPPEDKKVEYVVNISVYNLKDSYTINLKADQKYSKSQIRKIIEQEKNKQAVLKKVFKK